MWFGTIWHLLISIFVEKAVDKVVEGATEHVEPEESDWDWSKAPDANPDLKDLNLVIFESDASLFFGEICRLVERGFGMPQVAQMIRQIERLEVDQNWYVEYNVRAFERGTPLNLAVQRLDPQYIGILIWSDSALSFEIGSLIPKYDEGGKMIESSLGKRQSSDYPPLL